MQKLSREQQAKVKSFIASAARPLEQSLYHYFFENGTTQAVFDELAKFQNSDGGFGNALEPDLRLKDSSVIATTVAFQILRELKAPATNPLVQGGMRYLLENYQAENKTWPIIPANIDDAPHAPWWDYNPDLTAWLGNPRPEIAGYLLDYAELVPANLTATVVADVVNYLDKASDDMEMHIALCYLRLLETVSLPDEARQKIQAKMARVLEQIVSRDPASWREYGLQPIAVVTAPTSPFAPLFTKELETNLDFLIEQQQADGAWKPAWSWEFVSQEAWNAAERDIKGSLTLNNLRLLQRFSRLV